MSKRTDKRGWLINFAPTHVSEPEAVYRQRCRTPPSPVQPSCPAAPRAAAEHAGGSGRAPAQPPRAGAARGTTLQLIGHRLRLAPQQCSSAWQMAVGKNKRLSKGKKGKGKKV